MALEAPAPTNTNLDIAKKLANEHWEFIDNLLLSCDLLYQHRNLKRLLYTTAFEHGFKHGLEYASVKNKNTQLSTQLSVPPQTNWVYEHE